MTGHRFRDQAKRIRNKTGRYLQTAAWQTCKCLFWTVCSPCLCCIVLILPNRNRRTPRVHIEAPKPMLPCPRRRALTIQSTSLEEYQKTLPQDRSSFMTKLPLEIRRMIYEKALGDVPIHLALLDGKLNARRCSIRNCACFLQPLGNKHKMDIAIPLLRTCRRIYSEAIEYLYRANRFFVCTDLEDYPTTGYLPYFILSERITQITNFRLDWDFDRLGFFQVDLMFGPHLDEWYRTWDVLRSMTGLRTLHIRFFFALDLWQQCYGDFWKQNGKELLEPVKKITVPKDFVVTLPDWRCSTDLDAGESRCIFRLPERNDVSSS